MTKDQIAKSVAENAKCTYNDCHYLVYGYQRFHQPGYDTKESIMLITPDSRTIVFANMDGVVLEEENGKP